jgi:hypothetical protein
MRVRWGRRRRWCGYRESVAVALSDVRRLPRRGHLGIVTKVGLGPLNRDFDGV